VDGSRLVLAKDSARSRGGICFLTFEDGEQRWLDTPEYRSDQDAMLSPDGTMIATLTGSEEEDPGHAVIGLLDPATGRRRDLWQAVGSASWESGLCWSPDGRLIAATYMTWDDEYDDDALSTVIIDAHDGTVRAGPIMRSFLLGNAHAAWLGDSRLALRREYVDIDQMYVVDARTSQVTAGPEFIGHPWGIANGRIVYQVNEVERWDPEASTFYTTNLHNAERETLFAIHPKADIQGFHLALQAFAESLHPGQRSSAGST
jgi:hypothetical protein